MYSDNHIEFRFKSLSCFQPTSASVQENWRQHWRSLFAKLWDMDQLSWRLNDVNLILNLFAFTHLLASRWRGIMFRRSMKLRLTKCTHRARAETSENTKPCRHNYSVTLYCEIALFARVCSTQTSTGFIESIYDCKFGQEPAVPYYGANNEKTHEASALTLSVW